MENLGSEISQKMRSAIKAKLLELGQGYIDDELPDYVLIMVANKRSPRQMIQDLQLFLGTNTETFVKWLHEVLAKLKQVTLPQTAVGAAKRKSGDGDDKKRDKRREKGAKGHDEKTPEPPPAPSITKVITESVLQKAKETIELEKSANTKSKQDPEQRPEDAFDIPTISEMCEDAVERHLHQKELIQLEEIQRKINLAKKQLETMRSDEEENESEDDGDTLNLQAEEFEGEEPSLPPSQHRPPTVHVNPEFLRRQEKGKGSVHTRLGTRDVKEEKEKRVISLSTVRRAEREIYVPLARRALEEVQRQQQHQHPRIEHTTTEKPRRPEQRSDRRDRPPLSSSIERKESHDRRRSRDNGHGGGGRLNVHRESGGRPTRIEIRRSNHHSRRSRSRSPIRRRERTPPSKRTPRRDREREREREREKEPRTPRKDKTIGSKVIMIPPKPVEDEETPEVPVNSVIKIKPRTHLPENKQPSKTLLLRAIAEANRSTSASIKKAKEVISPLFVRTVQDEDSLQLFNDEELDVEDEYVPEPIVPSESENEYVYIPKVLASHTTDEEYDPTETMSKVKTQFVVTLDGAYERMAEQVSGKPARRPVKERIGWKNAPKSKQSPKKAAAVEKEKRRAEESPSRTPPPPKRQRRPEHRAISPINFKLTDDEAGHSSHDETEATPSKDKKKEPPKTAAPEEVAEPAEKETDEPKEKRIIKKLEPSRKFDDVPEFLSAVAVVEPPKLKPKERCRYFPNCRDGDACEFHHPTAPCNAFPNCKYLDKCLYVHPMCKFDKTCARLGCNYQHSVPIVISSQAPPLASSVVPVQSYKSVSITTLPPMCRFFPNCSNTLCTFYHPKPCRFGRACHNKIECNFYHFDLPPAKDRLKWVSSAV